MLAAKLAHYSVAQMAALTVDLKAAMMVVMKDVTTVTSKAR